jgi:hypothetical protein
MLDARGVGVPAQGLVPVPVLRYMLYVQAGLQLLMVQVRDTYTTPGVLAWTGVFVAHNSKSKLKATPNTRHIVNLPKSVTDSMLSPSDSLPDCRILLSISYQFRNPPLLRR